MKIKNIFLTASFPFLCFIADLFPREPIHVHAFKNYKGGNLQVMEVIGYVVSTGFRVGNEYKKILNYDVRENILTARLLSNPGLKIGDTIYVLRKKPDHEKYKDSFIIAKGQVFSTFKTELQGWLLKAKGNFLHVKSGFFVARAKVGNTQKQAYLAFKKGERMRLLKNYSKALVYYQKSLELDPQRPETYLRMANISQELNLSKQAAEYIEEAWSKFRRFEDINLLLELPGIYLKWQNKNIEAHTSQKIRKFDCSHINEDQLGCKRLKYALHVLEEIRKYLMSLDIFVDRLPKNTLSSLQTKGIPDYEFQYNFGELFLTIYEILEKHPPRRVVHWLLKNERDSLYKSTLLANRKNKIEPKKSWDKAYLEASLHRLESAHDLNPLDPRAAIKILELCYDELQKKPSGIKKSHYISIARHYGRKLKSLFQLKGYNWSAVRSMLVRISQL